MITIRPNSNLMLCKDHGFPTEIDGIAIPQNITTTMSQLVQVVAKGDGISEDEKVTIGKIKIGDILLVEVGSGQIVKLDEKPYLVCHIGQVLANIKRMR